MTMPSGKKARRRKQEAAFEEHSISMLDESPTKPRINSTGSTHHHHPMLPFLVSDFQPEGTTSIDIYGLLKLSKGKDSSDAEIKKAYYKLSLRCHPDRCPSDATEEERLQFKETFQFLTRIYGILSTPKLKQLYDESGRLSDMDDALGLSSMDSWEDYFKTIFEKVSMEILDRTKTAYVGSVEEEEDLLDFYVDFKGNMDKIIDHMFFADTAQEQRYIDIIDAAIAANRVKSYAAYGRTKNNEARWKKAKREAKEADQHIVDLGLEGKMPKSKNDLVAMIQSKRANASSTFLDKIQKKYCNEEKKFFKKNGKKKRNADDDEDDDDDSDMLTGKNFNEDPLSDEQFNALQQKLFRKAA